MCWLDLPTYLVEISRITRMLVLCVRRWIVFPDKRQRGSAEASLRLGKRWVLCCIVGHTSQMHRTNQKCEICSRDSVICDFHSEKGDLWSLGRFQKFSSLVNLRLSDQLQRVIVLYIAGDNWAVNETRGRAIRVLQLGALLWKHAQDLANRLIYFVNFMHGVRPLVVLTTAWMSIVNLFNGFDVTKLGGLVNHSFWQRRVGCGWDRLCQTAHLKDGGVVELVVGEWSEDFLVGRRLFLSIVFNNCTGSVVRPSFLERALIQIRPAILVVRVIGRKLLLLVELCQSSVVLLRCRLQVALVLVPCAILRLRGGILGVWSLCAALWVESVGSFSNTLLLHRCGSTLRMWITFLVVSISFWVGCLCVGVRCCVLSCKMRLSKSCESITRRKFFFCYNFAKINYKHSGPAAY